MLVAGAFALFLVAVLIFSFKDRRPTMFYELLTLPIVGVVLSIIGRRQIQNSEGTRTGLKLTSIAWWICVLGGGGFGAYVVANMFVLQRESANFATRFLQDLKDDRVNHAFLYSMDPSSRDRAAPANVEAFEVEYGAKGLV